MSEESLRLELDTPEQLFSILAEKHVKLVSFMFCDPLGQWVENTFLASILRPQQILEGLPFDCSSVKLVRSIDQSDMLMVPDLKTCFINPWKSPTTMHILVSIKDPSTDEWYRRDPRVMAKRALKYLESTGIADVVNMTPDTAFFIFDNVTYHTKMNSSAYFVDAKEGYWNSQESQSGSNMGLRTGPQTWYKAAEPMDTLSELRTEMLLTLDSLGVNPTSHHHEIATSQCNIELAPEPMLRSADNFMLFKYVVRNVAQKHNKSASFLPKPIYGDNGSGLHVHHSLWKDLKPLFYGNGPDGLSTTALYYIGGLLYHAPALCAFTNPTTNSYKRLVPGFEAPVNLVYSGANRSAAIRIPMYHPNDPREKNIEFRVPDPTLNPYMAFAAQLLAGLDGIANKIHPGNSMDVDIYELSPEVKEDLAVTPASLGDALSALEVDHDFLLAGGVFSTDFIAAYIEYKRAEISRLETAPHPLEYEMYYHI